MSPKPPNSSANQHRSAQNTAAQRPLASYDILPHSNVVPSHPAQETSSVTIRVRYYQKTREITGLKEELFTIEPFTQELTISDALQEITRRHPPLAALRESLSYARNNEFAHGNEVLHDGDTLDLMPPFSGG